MVTWRCEPSPVSPLLRRICSCAILLAGVSGFQPLAGVHLRALHPLPHREGPLCCAMPDAEERERARRRKDNEALQAEWREGLVENAGDRDDEMLALRERINLIETKEASLPPSLIEWAVVRSELPGAGSKHRISGRHSVVLGGRARCWSHGGARVQVQLAEIKDMLRTMGVGLGLELVDATGEITVAAWVFVGLNVLIALYAINVLLVAPLTNSAALISGGRATSAQLGF